MEKIEVIKRCANDLLFFGKAISSNSFTLESPSFHRTISSLLMDRGIPQLLIEAPRGTAKSTLTRLFAMHHYIFDPGDKVIVIQSKTLREAKRRLWKIKDTIEYGKEYRDLFGYHGEQAADAWREDYIKFSFNGNWVTIIPAGTGQQIRGLLEGDARLTLYLLDDPDDEENTKTIERTEDNFSKFLGGVGCLDRIRNGRVQVVGTPIGEGCIVARLRDSLGWVTVKFSACNEETGECLWEQMYDLRWLMNKKKELDEQGMLWKFYSEYMCELKGKDDQIFKTENFMYWDGEFVRGNSKEHYLLVKGLYDYQGKPIIEYEEPNKVPVSTFIGIDPAFSLNPKADFTVIMTIAIDKDRNIYVLPFVRRRMLQSELVETTKLEYIKHDPIRVTIETTSAQDTLRQALKNLDDIYIPGVGTKTPQPKDSKSKRYLDVIEEYHRRHKLFLMLNKCDRLKEEMIMHPSLSGHDDCNDGLYWAVVKSYPPDHTLEAKPEKRRRAFQKEENSWMVN